MVASYHGRPFKLSSISMDWLGIKDLTWKFLHTPGEPSIEAVEDLSDIKAGLPPVVLNG